MPWKDAPSIARRMDSRARAEHCPAARPPRHAAAPRTRRSASGCRPRPRCPTGRELVAGTFRRHLTLSSGRLWPVVTAVHPATISL
jgi:hypothetical protein